jgi:hypothetical protein
MFAIALVLSNSTTHAQSSLWMTASDGIFADRSRWSNGVPGPNGVAIFGAESSESPFTIQLASSLGIGSILCQNQRLTLDFEGASEGDPALLASVLLVARAEGVGIPSPSLTLRRAQTQILDSFRLGYPGRPAQLAIEDGSLTTQGETILQCGDLQLTDSFFVHNDGSQDLTVGYADDASVTLIGASSLTSDVLRVGAAGGSGTLVVGLGSSIDVDALKVGHAVQGTYGSVLVEGGSLQVGTCSVGEGGIGVLTLGIGASVATQEEMLVGSKGQGHLLVTGAAGIDGSVRLSGTNQGTAAGSVTGPGAALEIEGELTIYSLSNSPATFVVTDATLVAEEIRIIGSAASMRCEDAHIVTGALQVSGSASSSPHLHLADGTKVRAESVESVSQTTMEWELAGGVAATLEATGVAELEGTLRVVFDAGYVPPVGQVIPLITAKDIDGTFSTLDVPAPHGLPGLIDQDETSVTLRFSDHIDGLTIVGQRALPLGYFSLMRAFAALDGDELHVSQYVTWSSDDPGVVEIDDQGYVLAKLEGSARVHATFAGLDATLDVVVSLAEGPPHFQVISRTPAAQGNGMSMYADDIEWGRMSDDGRQVAYWSMASNLTVGDTNGTSDIFVATLDPNGELTQERVSVPDEGVAGSGGVGGHSPAIISPDGRFVAFRSSFNLVAGPAPTSEQIYIRDRLLGRTERVSVSSGGAAASGNVTVRTFSQDGRFLLFGSDAANLVPNDGNGKIDSFVRDRLLGTTARLPIVSPNGEDLGSSPLDISANGRFVLARSTALSGSYHLYLVDRELGTVEDLVDDFILPSPGGFDDAHLSDDGMVVAVRLSGTAPGFDPSIHTRLFVIDRDRGTIAGVGADGNGHWPCEDFEPACPSPHVYGQQISGPGRYVAFISRNSELVDVELPSFGAQVMRLDRMTGDIEVLSKSPGGEYLQSVPEWVSISDDGRTVAFAAGDGFAPFDSNGFPDVIVWRYGSGVTGDVNADVVVDSADVAALLAMWGTFDQSADLDGDGIVGPIDLSLVLGNWTP